MSKHWDEKELDAYGHLNWTVGNSDYLACFDAIRVHDGISYHVVINCESGGWIDTVSEGVVPMDKVAELYGLPDEHASDVVDQYPNGRGDLLVRERDTARCAKSWRAHLDDLCAQPAPEEDEDDHDEMGELRRAALSRGQP